MAAQVTIDIKSFVIGTLIGAIILVAIGWWHWDQEEPLLQSNAAETESERTSTSDSEALDYAAQFEHQHKIAE